MTNCDYCQVPFVGETQFCCRSCELLFNWNHHDVLPVQNLKKVSAQWQKYNTPELESIFNLSNCPLYKKFHFYIEGLQCSSCVHLLEDFPLFCERVVYSQVDFSKSTFDVVAQNTISLGTICEAIAQLGYVPKPIKELTELKNAQSSEKRTDLKRIGIAAAVAGNIMLFSTPIYTGVTGPLSFLFKWLSFLVFLPVITYLAIPFYKKTWASLLVRRINVDMMIVVALLSGFVLSTYALLLGTDDIYFDSTASFIFLILTTRYFLKRNQARLDKNDILSDLFDREVYMLFEGAESKTRSHLQLKTGDRIQVSFQQLVPCDTILEKSSAEFDLSYLTGESAPQLRHQGDQVAAGSRLLSEQAIFSVQTESQQSQLAQSIRRVEILRAEKQPTQALADLLSHRLTMIVFSIAALFFVATFQHLGLEAFKRCLALITIACPCAIAFGTPLANSLGLKKAALAGFFIKSESVFEKMSVIKKVIFDKTGTLTMTQMNLVPSRKSFSTAAEKEIILGLEKLSLHPVALSLKAAWPTVMFKEISQVTEVAGLGVQSMVEGHKYRLVKSKSRQDEEAMAVQFFKDDHLIDTLHFEEEIRPESQNIISKLKDIGLTVFMLTGDRKSRALAIGAKVGIPATSIFYDQTLDSKQQIIKQQNPCLYIGDGINDIAALTEASIGFAVKGPFESTFRACEVYAPKKDLHAVLELFDLSKKVQSTVKANLIFALLYNAIGGAFALAGFINPLVAALLMPLSSFIITSHTLWRLK